MISWADILLSVRFDIAKWCDLNGPAGGVLAATDTTVEGGYYNVELAGDDDEANMKAKREADANEKRCVYILSVVVLADLTRISFNSTDLKINFQLGSHNLQYQEKHQQHHYNQLHILQLYL